MTDSEVIVLIDKNASQGMKYLIDTYAPYVCAVVRGRLGDICSQDEIDECVNHVFTDFYFNRQKFRCERCGIKTFLTVMARNKSIEIYRQHIRRIGELHIEDEEFIDIPDGTNLEDDTEKMILERSLFDAINRLGYPDSQIIIRKYFYSQTSKRIAEDIGMTDASVRKHISRSLDKLRVILKNQKLDEGRK